MRYMFFIATGVLGRCPKDFCVEVWLPTEQGGVPQPPVPTPLTQIQAAPGSVGALGPEPGSKRREGTGIYIFGKPCCANSGVEGLFS